MRLRQGKVINRNNIISIKGTRAKRMSRSVERSRTILAVPAPHRTSIEKAKSHEEILQFISEYKNSKALE